MSVVIVGGGHGGFQTAASLRQEEYAGTVTLVSGEAVLPYHRPHLSKAYLKDGVADALNLRPRTFYERNDITLRLGTWVSRIDRDRRLVICKGGEAIPYEHLVLATGARNVRPPIAGLNLAGVLGLRDIEDAQRLRGAMEGARHVAIIGGGFIGLEFAAMARAAGIEVTVIEAASRLMARALSWQMSARFAAIHRQMGTELRLGRKAVRVTEAQGRAAGVALDDGSEIAADLVLLAAGVTPDIRLAAEAGLDVSDGVVVDSHLQTIDPAIFALGDCARFPCTRSGRPLRLESVQAATDQARAIARTIMGKPAAYDALAWFWSDQGQHKLQIAGTCGSDDETLPVGENIAIRLQDDRMTAVETIDAPGTHMAARRLLAASRPVHREELAAAGHDLVRLVKERA